MNLRPFKLMCVLAHPDDESLATGGILARYAAHGVRTSVLMATRGERGWRGRPDDDPGLQAVGRLRVAELRAAAQALGVREVAHLDYLDGELDRAEHTAAVARIVAHLRRVRPDVVVTFDPNGMYGHPDHIAISQLTTAAVMAAADHTYHGLTRRVPHRVAKLYYRAFLPVEIDAYEAAFGPLAMPVGSVERRFTAWPEWAVTTRIDVAAHEERVRRAIVRHVSQAPSLRNLEGLHGAARARLWTAESYYRAMSLVNGGREVESDLFAGLRSHAALRLPLHARQLPATA